MHIWTCWNFLSSPGQLQLGIDLHPKLSLRIQLISPKYNNLVLGSDMAWYACPWGLLVNSLNWGGFVKDLYCYLFLVSSPEPKAYWWAYRIGRPSVCRPRSLNIFSSETARPISQISYRASMGWGNESLFNRPGHMTKMALMPIYGKTLKNLFLWNQKVDDIETWYAALGARVLPSLFKWWTWVDLDLFYNKVKCALLSVSMGRR